MYMFCPASDSYAIETELLENANAIFCLDEDNHQIRPFNEESESDFVPEECHWRMINTDLQINKPLKASIPVGDVRVMPPILYATIITSWVVSLYTVCKTRYIPYRINERLFAERLDQLNRMN